jgi:hypothetical protein
VLARAKLIRWARNESRRANPDTVDCKGVATPTLERTIPLTLPWDETFDMGSDTGTPVVIRDYQVPFKFTGKINKLTVSVTPPVLTPTTRRSCLTHIAPRKTRTKRL